MRNLKRITAAFMAVLMLSPNLSTIAYATESNTPKEEVVYINLTKDGSVQDIYVVNIFELEKEGKIIDYGTYDSLRNMTTTDEITYENNMVTIDANTEKLYYEGKLAHNVIPWNISIQYYLDGKEYSASEIAGKTGALEIKLSIRENTACDSSFFEGYALQTTVTLDTNKCTNIIAEGATVANVGSDKQISYIILPNTETDITISADVREFEMNGIAMNGIRMNLNLEINDSKLQEEIDNIIGAVNDLDEGAGELDNGATDLYNATGTLNDGVGELYTGVGSLVSGASELKSGLSTLTSKNRELTGAAWVAYEALCTAAQTQINAQLTQNGLETVTLTPATYSDVLLHVLAQMDADAVYNQAYNVALAEVTAQVEAQADSLYSGYIQSQADAIYFTYVQSQADALYEQVASQAALQQLLASGLNEQEAIAYLQTKEGKALISQAIATMTKEQKEQIIGTAVDSLTTEQKEQILQGAISSLTKEQKTEIKSGYIEQMMATDEVTASINKAVQGISSEAASVSELKGQLDNYGVFYKGLVEYTNAVSATASGANELASGLSTLYSSTNILQESVGELHLAIGTLKDGTAELKDGTSEFVNETAGIDTKVSDEINSITSSIFGEEVETVSFASEQNTNIKSVQFVIQTENIKLPEIVEVVSEESVKLSFWQKVLRLFGWY